MNERQFRKAVQREYGRAIIYARHDDASIFRDEVPNACLHAHAVDLRCEGTHAGYMDELLELCPDRELYRRAILDSLYSCGDD